MFLVFMAAMAVLGAQDEAAPGDAVLTSFVGEWEGDAIAYNPFRPERGERRETIDTTCRAVLAGSYVQCDARWTVEGGASRDLMIFWNAMREPGQYEILYLYDNWPGKVQYPLTYDAETRTLTGYSEFEAGGRPAEERVRWMFSADGDMISSEEHVRYQGDEDWLLSFEFTWRRR